MLENKWLLSFLTLILGIMLGAASIRGITGNDKRGTEDFEKQQALMSQINGLKNQLQTTQEANAQLQAKFQRSTILYDGVVFKTRRWLIPADVDPISLDGTANNEFTHFDPKSQTETIHMQPKSK
jgi:hypothetical protein